MGFPDESACKAGYVQEIRAQSLGREDSLKNLTDRGVWQATVHGSQSLTRLGN